MQDRRQFLVGAVSSGLVSLALPALASVSVDDLIMQQSNVARRQFRLRTFKGSRQLDKVAQYYADYMARTGVFNHTADGRDLLQRMKKHGVKMGYMAENLAYRSSRHPADVLASAFVEGWLNSPAHRRNLLHPKLSHMGVGIGRTDSRVYAVQVFWG